MATIKDVAALAGVSVSTVSYALNGTRPISEKKKATIRAAAAALGYKPQAIARSLASGRTHLLAILFPPVDRGIGLPEVSLILEASRSALGQGYHLVIWTLETDEEDELAQLISQELVDGVIMMEVHREDWRIPVLRRASLPFILLGRDENCPGETSIDVDFFTTMMRCLSWLKELGHRRIVFINQSEKSFVAGYGPVVRTHDAFLELCRNLEIDGREYFCASSGEAARDRTGEILATTPGTTAFIVMNDKALPGVLAGITGQGLAVPGDVSVVSLVSSVEAASYMVPRVTVFEMDTPALVRTTVTQLIAKIESRYVEIPDRLIPCVLHQGDTVSRRRP